MRDYRDEMTPREREEFEQQKEIAILQGDYQVRYRQMDVEVRKLEARWSSWLRLPMAIVLLPIKFVLAFAIPISVITKKDLPDKFWEFMRG
jgi:hypothetical protein